MPVLAALSGVSEVPEAEILQNSLLNSLFAGKRAEQGVLSTASPAIQCGLS